MEKSNISRRLSDKMATARWTSAKPSTLRGDPYIHRRRSKLEVATIHFMQDTSNRISKLLVICNIITVHILAKNNVHLLRPVEDVSGLKGPDIYCMWQGMRGADGQLHRDKV
jgi:hypothetical protein